MYRVRRKRFSDYLFPPLILVAFIVTIVLSLRLYRLLTADKERVQLVVQQGGTHILVTPSGAADGAFGRDGMPLFSGDRVENSQAPVTLALRSFSGVQQGFFTLDPGAAILVQNLSQSGSKITLSFAISRGHVRASFSDDAARIASGDDTTLSLSLPHVRLDRTFSARQPASFSLEADSRGFPEKISYVSGEDTLHLVTLVDRGGVLQESESYDLSAKNMFVLDSAGYRALNRYQSPELIEALPATSSSEDASFTGDTSPD